MIDVVRSIIKDCNGKECEQIHKRHYDYNGNIVHVEHEIDGIKGVLWHVNNVLLNGKQKHEARLKKKLEKE